jgi:predicted nuclease with RNAse H fold
VTALAAGIDLSGRTTGTTAIAWLEGAPPRPGLVDLIAGGWLSGGRGDGRILRELADRRPAVVAIDAPLTLPHAVTCTLEDCELCFPADDVAPFYGSRWLDRAEAWKATGHEQKPPMPTVMVAGIAFRAIYLARLLRRAGLEVVETWPMGVYRVLARRLRVTEDDTGDDWRQRLLGSCVDRVDRAVHDGPPGQRTDRLDAVAAAYAAWSRLHDAAHAVESDRDPGEGAIWVPRADID